VKWTQAPRAKIFFSHLNGTISVGHLSRNSGFVIAFAPELPLENNQRFLFKLQLKDSEKTNTQMQRQKPLGSGIL
jgi:hypothetical protein